MKFGTILRKCCCCLKPVKQDITLSNNNCKTTLWTDGKMESSKSITSVWLARCPHCHDLFWTSEAEKIPEFSEVADALYYKKPLMEDYYRALEWNIQSKKKLQYLRIQIWWMFNDKRRSNPLVDIDLPPEAVDNLEMLYQILDEDEPMERLLKAEVARELGKFTESKRLLDYPFRENYWSRVAVIKKLTQREDSMVWDLNGNCNL